MHSKPSSTNMNYDKVSRTLSFAHSQQQKNINSSFCLLYAHCSRTHWKMSPQEQQRIHMKKKRSEKQTNLHILCAISTFKSPLYHCKQSEFIATNYTLLLFYFYFDELYPCIPTIHLFARIAILVFTIRILAWSISRSITHSTMT